MGTSGSANPEDVRVEVCTRLNTLRENEVGKVGTYEPASGFGCKFVLGPGTCKPRRSKYSVLWVLAFSELRAQSLPERSWDRLLSPGHAVSFFFETPVAFNHMTQA